MNQSDIVIELFQITKNYGIGATAVRALNDVSLHVQRGEIVLVMGPSGSGKTTLLQVTGALLKPTSGEIRILGKPIDRFTARELADLRLKTFGFVYQTPNLLAALTALQNVQLVLELAKMNTKQAQERAKELLQELGLERRLNHKPAELSGGEQQRVALARALANNPTMILADEPTANLDSKSGYDVVKILRDIGKKEHKTVLVVTHDTRIKNLADRILWLEDGRLRLEWRPEGISIDPVCLMAVDPKNTPYFSDHKGMRFYFCMERCKVEFDRNPEQFEFGIHQDLHHSTS